MATSGRGSGIVGYNVQTAMDTKHHLIVGHQLPSHLRQPYCPRPHHPIALGSPISNRRIRGSMTGGMTHALQGAHVRNRLGSFRREVSRHPCHLQSAQIVQQGASHALAKDQSRAVGAMIDADREPVSLLEVAHHRLLELESEEMHR
jgi:hypothetical protein